MPTATNCRVRNFLARHSFGLGLAVVWSALTIAAVVSWRKWPDLIVDFGLQLYIPWRLADGAVLYRDLFYMAGGPLSQYFHAALFKIFGTSFATLISSNLLITVGLVSLIYLRFRRVTDTVTGTLLAVAVVIGFAFADYSSGGNYNYLAPYSHEMLHGLTLGILTLALLTHDPCKNNRTTLLGAGFATGLVALTKPDIFLALMLTLLVFFGLAWRANRQPVRSRLTTSAIFIGAGLAPLIGFFLFFLRTESWQESLRLEFFGWRPLFIAEVVQNPFYQQCLGLDMPLLHVQQMARQFLICGLVVGGYAALFKWLKTQPSVWRLLASGLAISPLLMVAANFNWVGCGAALPLLSVTAIIILTQEYFKERNAPKDLFPLLWSVFGLLLLAKQGLFPRIGHTGFALAMPAFVSAVYLLGWALPRYLEVRYQVPQRPLRYGALAVLLIALTNLADTSRHFYAAKQLAVGIVADQIIANGPVVNFSEARTMNLALDWIKTNLAPTNTLAALPQGVLLNYLARRPNSTPCLDWNPTMLATFGATNMLARLQKNPPDYIALVEWPTYEFGVGYFGTPNYGGEVMTWIEKHYQTAVLFGSEPLRNGLFGIKILKHQAVDLP